MFPLESPAIIIPFALSTNTMQWNSIPSGNLCSIIFQPSLVKSSAESKYLIPDQKKTWVNHEISMSWKTHAANICQSIKCLFEIGSKTQPACACYEILVIDSLFKLIMFYIELVKHRKGEFNCYQTKLCL